MVGDVTKSEDLNRLLKETIKRFGKLDILVNNAGIYPNNPFNDSHTKFMKVFDQIMNVNLRVVVELSHLSVPYLQKSKGTIINTSTIASVKPVIIIN